MPEVEPIAVADAVLKLWHTIGWPLLGLAVLWILKDAIKALCSRGKRHD